KQAAEPGAGRLAVTMMGKRSLWVVEHASRRLSGACGPMMSRFKYATLRCPTKKYSIRTLEREHSTKTDAAMVPRKASFFEGELRFPRALYAMPAANEYARARSEAAARSSSMRYACYVTAR